MNFVFQNEEFILQNGEISYVIKSRNFVSKCRYRLRGYLEQLAERAS